MIMSVQTVMPFFHFSLQVNDDGTCSVPVIETEETPVEYPYVKGRRVTQPEHPDVAFYPEAVARVMDLNPHFWGSAEEWIPKITEVFPKVSNHGNLSHAVNQGLITELSICSMQKGRTKMYACNQTGQFLNAIAEQQAREMNSPSPSVAFDSIDQRLKFLKEWLYTANRYGLESFFPPDASDEFADDSPYDLPF